jgi:hypothetical protein
MPLQTLSSVRGSLGRESETRAERKTVNGYLLHQLVLDWSARSAVTYGTCDVAVLEAIVPCAIVIATIPWRADAWVVGTGTAGGSASRKTHREEAFCASIFTSQYAT